MVGFKRTLHNNVKIKSWIIIFDRLSKNGKEEYKSWLGQRELITILDNWFSAHG